MKRIVSLAAVIAVMMVGLMSSPVAADSVGDELPPPPAGQGVEVTADGCEVGLANPGEFFVFAEFYDFSRLPGEPFLFLVQNWGPGEVLDPVDLSDELSGVEGPVVIDWTAEYATGIPGQEGAEALFVESGSVTVNCGADSGTSTGGAGGSGSAGSTAAASAGADRAYTAPRTGSVAESAVPAALAGAVLLVTAGLAGRVAVARRN